MRAFCYAVLLAGLVACDDAPQALPQPLDGKWAVDSTSPASTGLLRTMTLVQHGSTVSGSGTGMGVDVPIPFDITGSYHPDPMDGPALVELRIQRVDGGRVTADFQGTLAPDRLTGSVVYRYYYGVSSVDSVTGTLSFKRP
jgi:hypothetical protein